MKMQGMAFSLVEQVPTNFEGLYPKKEKIKKMKNSQLIQDFCCFSYEMQCDGRSLFGDPMFVFPRNIILVSYGVFVGPRDKTGQVMVCQDKGFIKKFFSSYFHTRYVCVHFIVVEISHGDGISIFIACIC